MRSRIMLLFDVFAIFGILVQAWNVILALLVATIVGSDIIIVHLNEFGEQIFEAIALPLAGILGIVALVRSIWRLKSYDKG